jgi:cobalt/nickel transport protein
MKPREILFGLAAALLLALVLSPFASSWPDGLEKVAADKGFLHEGERKAVLAAPIPDYAWPGIKSERLSTRVAGVVGTLVVFVIAWGAAALVRTKHDSTGSAARSCFHGE